MKKSRLEFGGSSIEIHHRGAHLSSWVHQGKEQLFLSRKALLEPQGFDSSIRGGVPICFPQFGAFGPGKKHGFARNLLWQECDSETPSRLRFNLINDKHTLTLWPHVFKAQFDIELNSNALRMSLNIQNSGPCTIEFTAALHTYFAVEHIESVFVTGLNSSEFWDNGTPFSKREYQQAAQLKIREVIDRVYFNTHQPISLVEAKCTRLIESQGFADTVIWNPWREGARALSDMAETEYKKMLCIESANVQTPIVLKAGESWVGEQRITII